MTTQVKCTFCPTLVFKGSDSVVECLNCKNVMCIKCGEHIIKYYGNQYHCVSEMYSNYCYASDCDPFGFESDEEEDEEESCDPEAFREAALDIQDICTGLGSRYSAILFNETHPVGEYISQRVEAYMKKLKTKLASLKLLHQNNTTDSDIENASIEALQLDSSESETEDEDEMMN